MILSNRSNKCLMLLLFFHVWNLARIIDSIRSCCESARFDPHWQHPTPFQMQMCTYLDGWSMDECLNFYHSESRYSPHHAKKSFVVSFTCRKLGIRVWIDQNYHWKAALTDRKWHFLCWSTACWTEIEFANNALHHNLPMKNIYCIFDYEQYLLLLMKKPK